MIRGSLVPNITLFDESGALDLRSTAWHINWMFGHGVDGLFLTGSYGAGPLMSVEERIAVYRLAKSLADESGDHRTLIAHVGCIDTASTLRLAHAAEEVGVDAIGAVPPFYYKYSEDLVVDYYAQLVKATSLPVFAYNNPETSRFSFTVGTVRRLLDAGLAGMKDSPLNVGFVSRVFYETKLAGADFQMILGTSNGWLPFYYMGIRAMIGGMSNWAPEIMTALVAATESGDQQRAELLYVVMMDLSAKMHFTDSTIASQMALYARGFNGGFARRPMALPPRSDPRYTEIKQWLEGSFERVGIPLETA